MKFVIEKDAAQKVLSYLQTRPFVEVFQLIPLLTGLDPLEPRSEEDILKEHQAKRVESRKDKQVA